MVSLGCTICRGCQLDTCHVGIATQIESREEAQLKGLKKFTPQELDAAVEGCARFFEAMGEEVAELAAALGFERAQDLVGRSDLLVAARGTERVDLDELIRPLGEMLDLDPLDLPLPDEREAAGLVAARPVRMAARDPERVLGTAAAGALARERIRASAPPAAAPEALRLATVAGQGLAAFGVEGLELTLEGGAQDGVAKGMFGGKVAVMKGVNRLGRRVNGCVGKSFAYGAQRGRLFVQGDADSRFCIRLSGADVVAGGEPAEPLDDSLGCDAGRANLKGFAFEYMTAGRAVVLGDPGPWFCAGQTGGRVYLRVNPAWNLDRAALERRLGKGARVELVGLDDAGEADVRELLSGYAAELRATAQDAEAERVLALAAQPAGHFLMSVPEREQTDPSVSTE
jgi:glutamate synthase (NADPH/NADH) large chain